MDKSEPALVPEWLRASSSSTNGGGNSHHHIASLLKSDDRSTNSTSSKLHLLNGKNSTSRSSDRKSSQFRRSSSGNGSVLNEKVSSLRSQSYTSFSKSQRERDLNRDFDRRGKDRIGLQSRESSDPSVFSTDVLVSRDERDALRRSFSNLSAKRGEVLSNNVANGLNSKPCAAGSIYPRTIKSSFERDFPSLRSEEKTGAPEVRVKSPGLISSPQSLPINSSTVIGGEGWTSLLAEVPVITGGSSSVVLPAAESAPVSSAGISSSANTGLNMAEALVQGPVRTRTALLSSVETQRLEEFAIKQSRQLIPVTPSMSKSSAPVSLDKSKSKGLRSNELGNANKTGQLLPSSQLVSHSLRGSYKGDNTRNSQPNSNFVILNRERNGYPTSLGDGTLSPTHANAHIVASSTAPVALSNSPSAVKMKSVAAKVTQVSMADRKLSQSQNRNEFFNSLRKKSSVSNDHMLATPDSALSAIADKHKDLVENSGAFDKEGKATGSPTGCALPSLSHGESAPFSSNGSEVPCSEEPAGIGFSIAFSNEEEEAFLKSLGWDASAEEEDLTEEEIEAFRKEYNKFMPTSKLCRHLNGINLMAEMENTSCSSVSNPNA